MSTITTNQNNTRIAKNTLFLYTRMLLVMAVTIYTSRIVLEGLGVTNYGIYNVIGGVVAFLGFLNSSMANAVQRFLSFELGKNNLGKLCSIFTLSMLAHVIIIVVFVLILEIIGPWFLNNHLNVPNNRLYAANVVLQCTIITASLGFLEVPYRALIISREEMKIYAYIGIIEVIFRLIIAYIILIYKKDSLVLYVILQVVVSTLTLLFYVVYSHRNYREAKFVKVTNWSLLKSITGFATWNLLGEFSFAMAGQGVNIILNIFCGPVVNAAKGIAEQVNAAVSRFIQNFQTAINPQITKTYSVNELSQMFTLLNRGCRFSYYIQYILSLPLLLEMNFILHLWLVDVPRFSTPFCQWVIICSLVTVLTNLLTQAIRATGKIRNYQVTTALIQLLNFPISYVLLKNEMSPVSTVVISVVIQAIIGYFRIFFLGKLVNYKFSSFVNEILIPVGKVTVLGLIVPLIIRESMDDSIVRFILSFLSCLISIALAAYLLGISRNERLFINKKVCQVINSFSHFRK